MGSHIRLENRIDQQSSEAMKRLLACMKKLRSDEIARQYKSTRDKFIYNMF